MAKSSFEQMKIDLGIRYYGRFHGERVFVLWDSRVVITHVQAVPPPELQGWVLHPTWNLQPRNSDSTFSFHGFYWLSVQLASQVFVRFAHAQLEAAERQRLRLKAVR